jgi:hypothetical protein
LSELPFDKVRALVGGRNIDLTLEQFLALTLPERIRLILEPSTQFSNDGSALERRIALARLRAFTAEPRRAG